MTYRKTFDDSTGTETASIVDESAGSVGSVRDQRTNLLDADAIIRCISKVDGWELTRVHPQQSMLEWDRNLNAAVTSRHRPESDYLMHIAYEDSYAIPGTIGFVAKITFERYNAAAGLRIDAELETRQASI